MKILNKKEKSFTVIELLVVLAIFGLIASIIIVAVKGARERAQTTNIFQFSSTIKHSLGSNIAGEWNFENNLNDSSGYNNNCIWNGSGGANYQQNTALSQLGKSILLDGTSNYLLCGNSTVLNMTTAVTISVWINPTISDANRRYVAAKRTGVGSPNNYNIEIYNNKFEFWVYNGAWYGATSGSNLDVGSWQNWVVTYSQGAVKMYKNGKLESSLTCSPSCSFPVSLVTNTQNFSIGGSNDGAKYFSGYIDEVRIYNEALTTAQIQQLYAEGLKSHKNLAGK